MKQTVFLSLRPGRENTKLFSTVTAPYGPTTTTS